MAGLIAFAVPASAAPAPLADLVASVDIPYESFQLPNGLRVIVHTDRKAPVVSVGVWYHVGSKDEPLGKAGYAHLFEHLMFYGSEHNPAGHFQALEDLGASDFNGTTSFDRTNYYETVPTPALPLTLFLESDRMGWLLPAVTQKKLDTQRDVVLREKQQGDNQPYGLVRYEMLKALFPPRHPLRVSPIGRVEDLKKASLADISAWFRDHYGPNNAVLVLAGDIDLKTAHPLVEDMFGNIPAGPEPLRFQGGVPERHRVTRQTMTDRIANPRVTRFWVAPPDGAADSADLEIALAILASGPTSRLYRTLVRNERLAVSVGGGAQLLETAGIASISVDVAPGIAPELVEKRIGEILAGFRDKGPTMDEVERVAMRAVAGTIRDLERIGGLSGKGAILADGALTRNDPDAYKHDLAHFAGATPDSVRTAAGKWLGENDHRLTILPGKRTAIVVDTDQQAPVPVERTAEPFRSQPPPVRKHEAPDRGGTTSIHLPKIEHATLDNGMALVFARMPSVPVVRIALDLPLGVQADSREKPGLGRLTLNLLDEGSHGRLGQMDGPETATRLERLGARFSTMTTLDRTQLHLNALTPNLAESIALFADIVRAPLFEEASLARVRTQALAGLENEMTSPGGLAYRALPPLLYGRGHPYGASFTGSGTKAGLQAITRADVVAFHQKLARKNGVFFVVGDTDLGTVRDLLNRAFADWPLNDGGGEAPIGPPVPQEARVVLIDRPGSTQSLVMAGDVLSMTGADDVVAINLANDVLGGLPSSRLFQELREKRGWSYGASSSLSATRGPMPFLISTSVTPEQTANTILAIRDLLDAFRTTSPPTADEAANARSTSVRSLAGELETGGALLSSMARNRMLHRPDNYLESLSARIDAATLESIRKAPLPDAHSLKWVIVGDRATVGPQLDKAGLSWSAADID